MAKEQAIVQGLVKRGLSPAHAAMLAGDIQQESSFNPAAWNAKEGAGGLIQWRLDRLQNLLSFAKKNGQKPGSVETQLDFLVHEMTNGSEKKAGSKFLAAKTPQQMNKALRGYIRYGDNSQGTRLQNGLKFLGSAAPVITPAGVDLAEAAPTESLYDQSFVAPEAAPQAVAAPVDNMGVQPIPVSKEQAATDDAEFDAFMKSATGDDKAKAEGTTPAATTPEVDEKEFDSFLKAATGDEKTTTIEKQPGTVAPKAAPVPEVIPQESNIAQKFDAPVSAIPTRNGVEVNDFNVGGQNSMLQGMSLGAADEIAAAVTSPINALKNRLTGEGPTSLSENYQQSKAMLDANLASERENMPVMSTALEIGGGLMTGGAGAAKTGVVTAAKAPGMVNKLMGAGKAVGTGAAMGAAYGFNTGDNMEERIQQAKEGLATGAVAGAVAPLAVKAGAGLGAYFLNLRRAGVGAKGRAQKIVNNALDGGDPMANGGQIIPGSVPSLAETSGNANVALLQKQVRDANPELFVSRGTNGPKGLETVQNEAREAFISALRKDSDTLDNLELALSQQEGTAISRVVTPGPPVNTKPVLDKIDAILAGPSGGVTDLQTVMKQVRSKLVDAKGNPTDQDALRLYKTVRTEIKNLFKTDGGLNSTNELKQVRAALDDVIESSAPGFKKTIKEYADKAKPVDAMRYLQKLNLFDTVDGVPKVSQKKVEAALVKIKNDRLKRGVNDAKALSKKDIEDLETLQDDLRRSASVNVGKSFGSPTSQNQRAVKELQKQLPSGGLISSKIATPQAGALIGSGINFLLTGGTAGTLLAPAIGAKVGSTLQKAIASGDKKVMAELENLMLNPDRVKRLLRGKDFATNKLTRGAIAGSVIASDGTRPRLPLRGENN